MIPKIINKVFICNDMNFEDMQCDILKNAHNSWKELNPNYTIRYWNGKDCEKYLLENFGKNHLITFQSLLPYAYKCDFFRYCVIYNEGGFYSDWKQLLLTSLDDIINDSTEFISFYDKGCEYSINNQSVSNAFFGAIPKHPILKDAIDQIILNVKNKYYGNFCLDPTGPYVLGESYKKIYKDLSVEEQKKYITGVFSNNYFNIDTKQIIMNKCVNNHWGNGNDYAYLWSINKIYR